MPHSVSSLPELDAVAPSAAPKTRQQRLEAVHSTGEDLCQLDALYIVSAPGLHASDLARFPSLADSPNGMRAAVRNAHASGGHVQIVPYVSDRLAVAPVGKLARRFLRCPGAEKDLQFVRFDGLLADDAETVTSTADESRRMILQQLGASAVRPGYPRTFLAHSTWIRSQIRTFRDSSPQHLPTRRSS